ncbi:hypothetical protein CHLNCDRAFT_57482 [Chlorella variabilis]|uniref:TNFR-Cys domain-containing protein n=1 Tax=Chlorella variabilis TaxID=554065 RepID=E1ZC51_CHLVA|nr:hypothetical protein CHLNCDRAFT_57482 [Chlorella variabilis]EFN56548.1 hypothetical protein CHLNCDRAFT_57482 [Chlorella variabilis]|eukprot:XP_005848650.1 hypothetical protein CHLNCDRAFT_57482 [Chlorella variabilis]
MRAPLSLLALCAALLLATGAAAKCTENTEGWDDLSLGGCKTCSADNSTCEECWPRFSLNAEGSCVECNGMGEYGAYCTRCDPEDPSFCLECRGDDEGNLDFGLYGNEEGKCTPCPLEGCQECAPLNGTCQYCRVKQGLIDGKCQACEDDSALFCNGGVSTECYSGSFPDTSTGTCQACPANCDRCAGAGVCDVCDIGFGPDAATGACVPCESEGCQSCSSPGVCDMCEYFVGYWLDGGACQKCAVKHCAQCDGDVDFCNICNHPKGEYGANPTTGACDKCAVADCANCEDDYARCRLCRDGFYYDEAAKQCVACSTLDPHCTDCGAMGYGPQEGAPTCTECGQGWEVAGEYTDVRCIKSKD